MKTFTFTLPLLFAGVMTAQTPNFQSAGAIPDAIRRETQGIWQNPGQFGQLQFGSPQLGPPQFLTLNSSGPKVCAAPLLEAPLPNADPERLPAFRPVLPEKVPMATLPAPPCVHR